MSIKKLFSVLLVTFPGVIFAQDESQNGIKWSTDHSFDEVKHRAIQENKYIFIDAYATWCGPCKAMDKQVYVNDTIGDYFNEKFISVKVQMDKTKKDNDFVKNWYNDAEALKKLFKVDGYPTFVFLSPQGNMLEKVAGFKKVNEFIAIAQDVTKPGKVYVDPNAEYYKLVDDFRKGVRDYERMPYLIRTALKLKENETALKLVKEHTNYISQKTSKERYSKENIEVWSLFTLSSNTKIFQFFHKDGKFIDKVMRKKGYSEKIIDRTIKDEIINPFFKEENKDSSMSMSGMMLGGGNLKADLAEANWEKLYQLIKQVYNSEYAERNVLKSKIEWYKRHRNAMFYSSSYLLLLKKYSIDLTDLNEVAIFNSFAWSVFLRITEKEIIDRTIKHMGKFISQNIKVGREAILYELFDTYANLLYKAGRLEEAISWEEKAYKVSTTERSKVIYGTALEQMRKGEPTYSAQSVVWGYK